MEGHKAGFEVLAEEAAAFGDGPFDTGLGDGYLDRCGIGDGRKEVEELAHWTECGLDVGCAGIENVDPT